MPAHFQHVATNAGHTRRQIARIDTNLHSEAAPSSENVLVIVIGADPASDCSLSQPIPEPGLARPRKHLFA